ncbi:putative Homeobox domain-containing protein [Septoria linicola]|nr:putative Homeobox domain-containing protein [Septoria linicola]
MLQERFKVPLSPPNSPRMSDAVTKSNDYRYQQAPQRFDHDRDLREAGHGQLTASTEYAQRQYSSGQRPSNVSHAPYDASAESSPRDRLTPRSPASMSRDQLDDDDDLVEFGGDDQDEDDDSEKPALTPQELRAQKRKMKRFRLTHNQTRFLMSEFARQAHPDAAHRERLAREIPGLSARQVQVWFQNRRAKLKRLTNDDRERMLRSRALPADFDTTQALHSPFGAQASSMGASVSTLGAYGYGDSSGVRPLTLDTLRRVPDYEHYNHQYSSPTGVSPALSAFGFTPPQSASDHLSPGSVASSMSPYVLQHSGPYDRRPPTGLPTVSHTSYPAQQQQLHRMPLHERLGRNMGEPTGSPLRSSVSYANLTSASAQPRHIPERAASFSDHTYPQQRPHIPNTSSPSGSSPGPHGLGFSYSQLPNYQQGDQQNQVPMTGTYQSTEQEQFRRHLPPSYAQYPLANFAAQPSQYSGYAPPYSTENYQNSYAQHGQVTEPVSQPSQQQQGYQAAGGAPQTYMQVAGQTRTQGDGQNHLSPSY